MDANDIRDALRQLTELLPSVAERMAALTAEEAAAKAAADEFLQRAEERQTEASDLLARLETVQLELRAQASPSGRTRRRSCTTPRSPSTRRRRCTWRRSRGRRRATWRCCATPSTATGRNAC
jgi:hypothetical protein